MAWRRAGRAALLCAVLFLFACALAFAWRMAAPVPALAAPAPGDCLEIELISNGWHSDLTAPATLFPPDHPLRRRFPEARRLSFGWGDRDVFRHGAQRPWLYALLLMPQRPSVLHVAADAPWAGERVAITRGGGRALADYVTRSLRLGEDGPVELGQGLTGPRSAFFESGRGFSVLYVCNHWMADGLRRAGLPVSGLGAWTGESVRRQIAGGPRCPARRIAPA